MAKIDLVRYKALAKGWSKRDYQRVYKKIVELSKQFEGGSIFFNDAEELAMMLDEPVDYKLEFSLCRLLQEEKIFFNRIKNNLGHFIIEIRKF